MKNLTKEEEEGIKAIIYLQKLADIDEPKERALRNWRSFKDWEKEQTMGMYNLLKE